MPTISTRFIMYVVPIGINILGSYGPNGLGFINDISRKKDDTGEKATCK